MKAVALLSGGLDSTIAAALIKRQGVEVHGLHVHTFPELDGRLCVKPQVTKAADQLGIELHVLNAVDEFIQAVKKPKHGYGQGANPCIDCRVFQLKMAHAYMKEKDGAFLVTGEVLGQRPMSQNHRSIMLIEKEADVTNLVVRPLCAQALEPSIPEQKGWIDRSQLFGFTGRTRKPQIQLATQLGIREYPQPAGGCFLTEPSMALRVHDLKKYNRGFTANDLRLLLVGRHFRISPHLKAVVGRNERENELLEQAAMAGDLLFDAGDVPGPTILARGRARNGDKQLIAQIAKYYGKGRGQEMLEVICRCTGTNEKTMIRTEPIDLQAIQTLSISR